MVKFIIIGDIIIGFYFLASALSTFLTLYLSWRRVGTYLREKKNNEILIDELYHDENEQPKVSLIVPAYNEELVLNGCVHSLMNLFYSNFEIIVIDDGSVDMTAFELISEFDMVPVAIERTNHLSSADIFETYQSTQNLNLKLIRQHNKGKACALNTGIDFSSGILLCTLDADTAVNSEALLKMVTTWKQNPSVITGVSGTVRILNGADFEKGHAVHGTLPKDWLSRFQVCEYIRSFYSGRLGWDKIHSTVLMSGACSLFKKSALEEVGGFNEESVTEDLEIVVRIRSHFSDIGIPSLFIMLPDPVCWTQAPLTLRSLRKQRLRWQSGLTETLKSNSGMIFNPKVGPVGMTVIPSMVAFEWIEPFMELLGYLFFFLSVSMNILSPVLFVNMLGYGLFYSTLVTLGGFYLEEKYFSRYHHPKDYFTFFISAILENIGYRQLNWIWRLEATITSLFVKHTWQPQERRELHTVKSSQKKAA